MGSLFVQSFSCVRLFATPQAAAHQTSLTLPSPRACSNSHLLSLWTMPSNHLILCHPPLLSSVFPSIRIFSDESILCIRWPKDWSFSFSISPSNEYSGLISFRIDWFDLLAVQGILQSLFQHHSSKASVLQQSTFFMVQLSCLTFICPFPPSVGQRISPQKVDFPALPDSVCEG